MTRELRRQTRNPALVALLAEAGQTEIQPNARPPFGCCLVIIRGHSEGSVLPLFPGMVVS
jgi:hypothetical protein